MRIEVTRDPRQFAERAQRFLASRIERNILATGLDGVLASAGASVSTAGDSARTRSIFAIGCEPDSGEVVAAAIRTPPWPLLATGIDDATTAGELLELWLSEDPDLAGVNAELATARVLSEAWIAMTGGTTECLQEQAFHALTEVSDPPRPASGTLRVATAADRDLVLEWAAAFSAEDGGTLSPGKALTLAVDRELEAGHQFIWDDGQPVSCLHHSTEVAGAVRIRGVYTPPGFRSRGYASSAVATLSRRLLERGAGHCVLNTDLANPTSNKIYAQLGYVRVADFERYRLLR